MRRTETPKPIWTKFCTVVDIPDIVTYTNFGDHRLKGFRVAGGHEISPSPIDFHRRPYNTLALPCERVIRGLKGAFSANFRALVAKLCIGCEKFLKRKNGVILNNYNFLN